MYFINPSNVSPSVNRWNGRLRGVGAASTTLATDSTSGSLLISSGAFNQTLEDISLTNSTTSGARSDALLTITGATTSSSFRNLLLQNYFIGIDYTSVGSGNRLYNIMINSPYYDPAGPFPAFAGIQVGHLITSPPNPGADLVFRDVTVVGNGNSASPPNGTAPLKGIVVFAVGDLTLSHVETSNLAGNGLDVAPAAGQQVQSLFINDSFFDTGKGHGIIVEPANGSGVGGFPGVTALSITNTWVASNGFNGIMLSPAAGGLVNDVRVVNCTCINNGLITATSWDLLIGSSGVSNVQVNGGTFGGQAGTLTTQSGIGAVSGATQFSIIGAKIGAAGQVGPLNVGISLQGSNDVFRITNNDVSGNTTPISLTGYNTSGTGSGMILQNLGYNPQAITSAVGVGASPATICTGPSQETHYINQSATNTGTVVTAASAGSLPVLTLANPSTWYAVWFGPNTCYTVNWTTTQPNIRKVIN